MPDALDVIVEDRRLTGLLARGTQVERLGGGATWSEGPLWLPADMPGHSTRTNAVYRSTGGALRPISETLARTLDDERARGLDRERQSGLSRADELALIADLSG